MAKLTIKQYFDNLRAIGQTLAEENMPLEIAARDTVAMEFNRIFVDGKDSKGGKIGNYNNTKPLYADPKLLPRAVPAKGKNGADNKTAYFESYKALREAMGVQTKYVDLNFSGRLGFNFVNSSVSASSNTISARPVKSNEIRLEKINKLQFVVRLNKENMGKARGNEVHFSTKIFALSKEEKENFKKVMKFETIRLANNA